MEQHPNCRCEFEDFKESNTLIARCDVCFTLDGRTCIGGVHKRREQPAPAPGNYIILGILLCYLHRVFYDLYFICV